MLEGEHVVVTPVGDDVVIVAAPVKPLRLVSEPVKDEDPTFGQGIGDVLQVTSSR
jgi:hypothetical protein